MLFQKKAMTVTELFVCPTEMLLIDTRGATDYDPAIPGSKSCYILDLLEKTEAFQEKYDALLREKEVVLICRKGDGTTMLRKKFARKYNVLNLEGGMVAYLELITRLLAEHPYEQPHKRDTVMRVLLGKLTDRQTPFPMFRRIADRLIRSSPDAAIRQLRY